MWKIDSDDNAYNERGERIFFSVSVSSRHSNSCTNWLGDFKTVEEAREWLNAYIAEEFYINVPVLKQAPGCGGHRKHLGDFISIDDAKDFIRQTVTKLNAEETNHDRRPMAQTPA